MKKFKLRPEDYYTLVLVAGIVVLLIYIFVNLFLNHHHKETSITPIKVDGDIFQLLNPLKMPIYLAPPQEKKEEIYKNKKSGICRQSDNCI